MKNKDDDKNNANRDPITGAPGSHPVGTGLGALAGGAAAGAAAGTVAGPIGTVVGAAAGAIVGGLAGKAAGEAVDPTAEDAFWTRQYSQEPYYTKGRTYSDYAPAYRTGYESQSRLAGSRFEDVESDLQASYERARGDSSLDWQAARPATRAAWDRVNRHGPDA
jgi:hypothetical protein